VGNSTRVSGKIDIDRYKGLLALNAINCMDEELGYNSKDESEAILKQFSNGLVSSYMWHNLNLSNFPSEPFFWHLANINEFEGTRSNQKKEGDIIKLCNELWAKLSDKFASNLDTKLTPEINNFCDKYNIKEYFSEVNSIIKSCFSDIQNWDVDIVSDPETDDSEWISIEISISGEISDILERYDQYTDILISKIPWTYRDKIRLTYNILGK